MKEASYEVVVISAPGTEDLGEGDVSDNEKKYILETLLIKK